MSGNTAAKPAPPAPSAYDMRMKYNLGPFYPGKVLAGSGSVAYSRPVLTQLKPRPPR